MRWGSRFALKAREGEWRIRRKFLLLPRQFGEDTECRWLEWAWVIEVVRPVSDISGDHLTWKWFETSFSDDKGLK